MDILFVLWAVRALTEARVRAIGIDGRHTGDFEWLREWVAASRIPAEIHDYFYRGRFRFSLDAGK